jgi:hypothetical protein
MNWGRPQKHLKKNSILHLGEGRRYKFLPFYELLATKFTKLSGTSASPVEESRINSSGLLGFSG